MARHRVTDAEIGSALHTWDAVLVVAQLRDGLVVSARADGMDFAEVSDRLRMIAAAFAEKEGT